MTHLTHVRSRGDAAAVCALLSGLVLPSSAGAQAAPQPAVQGAASRWQYANNQVRQFATGGQLPGATWVDMTFNYMSNGT